MKETGRTFSYHNDQLGETDYGQRTGKVNVLGVPFLPSSVKGEGKKERLIAGKTFL